MQIGVVDSNNVFFYFKIKKVKMSHNIIFKIERLFLILFRSTHNVLCSAILDSWNLEFVKRFNIFLNILRKTLNFSKLFWQNLVLFFSGNVLFSHKKKLENCVPIFHNQSIFKIQGFCKIFEIFWFFRKCFVFFRM